MNLNASLSNILFLDIETVPEYKNWGLVPDKVKILFEQKTAYQRGGEIPIEDFYERAGIWAEFGKVICISVGYFIKKNQKRIFRLK